MDDIGHKSGHLMLITPERVFYAGLLGRPRQRCSGAFNIYVSIEGGLWLTTADGRESYGEMVAVLPNVRHTIASDYRSVLSIVIEPESVRPGVLEDFAKRLSGPEGEAFASRIRAAYLELREHHERRRILQCRIRYAVPWRSAAAARTRSARGALDRADRKILRRAGDGGELRRGGRTVAVALPASVQGRDRNLVPLVPRLEAGAASAAFRQPGHQPCASGAGYRLSRLHAFQPLDPPLLRLEAARDLFRFARSRDLQPAVAPPPTIAGGRKKPADAGRMIAKRYFRDPRVSQSKADPWATRPSLPAR